MLILHFSPLCVGFWCVCVGCNCLWLVWHVYLSFLLCWVNCRSCFSGIRTASEVWLFLQKNWAICHWVGRLAVNLQVRSSLFVLLLITQSYNSYIRKQWMNDIPSRAWDNRQEHRSQKPVVKINEWMDAGSWVCLKLYHLNEKISHS